MRRYPHLMNRNGHYYFRISVPINLRALLGQREVFYSLKTKDLNEAKLRSWELLTAAHDTFQYAYKGGTEPKRYLHSKLREISFTKYNQTTQTPLGSYLSEPQANAQKLLSKVFTTYLSECKGDREKTINKKIGVLDLWIEIIGDISTQRISKEHAREFKRVLMLLYGHDKAKDQSTNPSKRETTSFQQKHCL